jgi:hypothetical protein
MTRTRRVGPPSKEWLQTKIAIDLATGCWEWTGGLFASGYGAVGVDRKVLKAHRVAWALYRGEVGAWHVLHRCDNPKCCNPDHLYLGTHADNMADRAAKGRAPGSWAAPIQKRKHRVRA